MAHTAHKLHTNGTAYIRGTYREYTHKHTRTQTNTQRGPTKYGADSRRGGALLIRGGRLAPAPSKLHLCRDLPRRSYVHRHRKALCLPARATSTSISSLRSRWYCRFVSLFRTFSWIRRKSRTPPPARSCPAAVGLEEQHQQVPTVSQRDSAWA